MFEVLDAGAEVDPTEPRVLAYRALDERLKAARSNLRFQDRRVADLEAQIAST